MRASGEAGLRWSVARFSPRRIGFDSNEGILDFDVDTMKPVQICSRYFLFPQSVLFHHCHRLIHSPIIDTIFPKRLKSVSNARL
jgi:hypothetical protein